MARQGPQWAAVRHGRAPMLLAGGLTLLLVISVLAARLLRSEPDRHRVERVDASSIVHRAGVYAISGPEDVIALGSLGWDLVVTRWESADAEIVRAADTAGVAIVDTTIQKELYRAKCPEGPASCRDLDQQQMDELLGTVREHVASTKGQATVAGLYLTDDFWTSMREELPAIHKTIRVIDPVTPTVCGIGMTLATSSSPTAPPTTSGRIDYALENYSPGWCDAVLLYAYAVGSADPTHRFVEWDMASTLPRTLAALRARGWDPARSPLIGTPQAFGDHPRTVGATPRYRPTPTAQELATQVRSFCESGAQSIVGYAWDDGSPGEISLLSNAASLREGFGSGIRACRILWKRP